MIYLRRALVFAAWSGTAFFGFGFAMFFFTFGDCLERHSACFENQMWFAYWIPIVFVGIYGIVLGVLLQRWLLGGNR